MRKSVWEETSSLPTFNKAHGEKKTDVLIIGGGICGILCAYFLKQAGIDYILTEGKKIASGTTKNTTAKITSLHGLIYNKLASKFDESTAKLYLYANQDALKEYQRLCKGIDCDFEKKDAYTYSLYNRQKIEDEVETVLSLGFSADFFKETELPFRISGAIRFPDQAQFNPLKFILSIAKDLNIFEDTFIHDITPTHAISDSAKIRAEKIIITTHFPFINKHGNYFLKLYQHRSYVSAFKNVQKLEGMYVDEDLSGLSFREYNNLLLLGGGSHRTGKQGGNWAEINEFAKKYYPDAELRYEWSTQDCMSLDSLPYIGLYSKHTPNLYVATGFNKWGMTNSMIAAKILCDMVMGKENPYSQIFSPSRSIIKPQLFINGFETAMNFLTPTTKRCPHLGCALKWNSIEHSWDCPCHGSRFEENGRLIDNPATGDLDIK